MYKLSMDTGSGIETRSFPADGDQDALDRVAKMINPRFRESHSLRKKGKGRHRRPRARFSRRDFKNEGFISLVRPDGETLYPAAREREWEPKKDGTLRKRRPFGTFVLPYLAAA